MKKIRLLSIFMVAILLVWCGSNSEKEDTITNENYVYSPDSEYNIKLSDITNTCYDTMSDTINQYDQYKLWTSTAKIAKTISSAITTCETSADQINSLWSRDWDSSMRDGAIILIDKILSSLRLLEQTLVYLDPAEDLTPQEVAAHNAISQELVALESDINDLASELLSIQEEFAEKYDLTLIE